MTPTQRLMQIVKIAMKADHKIIDQFTMGSQSFYTEANSHADFYGRALSLGVIDQKEYEESKDSFNGYSWSVAHNH